MGMIFILYSIWFIVLNIKRTWKVLLQSINSYTNLSTRKPAVVIFSRNILWTQDFKNTSLYHIQYLQCVICCPHRRSRRLWWLPLRSTIIPSSWSHTLDKWPQYSQTEPTGLLLSIFFYLSALSWFLYPFYLSPRIQSLPAPVEGKLHCRGRSVCVCVCICAHLWL